MSLQRRALDEDRHVAQLQRADLEGIDPRQLQPAQPDVADAGAERVGDRHDARGAGPVGRVSTVLSAPVSTTKSCADEPFTFARTMIFSFSRRKSTV
jgi:hypothetical protein